MRLMIPSRSLAGGKKGDQEMRGLMVTLHSREFCKKQLLNILLSGHISHMFLIHVLPLNQTSGWGWRVFLPLPPTHHPIKPTLLTPTNNAENKAMMCYNKVTCMIRFLSHRAVPDEWHNFKTKQLYRGISVYFIKWLGSTKEDTWTSYSCSVRLVVPAQQQEYVNKHNSI